MLRSRINSYENDPKRVDTTLQFDVITVQYISTVLNTVLAFSLVWRLFLR
jgi:hypothetical protein